MAQLRSLSRPPQAIAAGRTLRLAALPTAPHLARVFVADASRRFRLPLECGETARLLVSELVTNAVKATGRADGPAAARPTEFVATVVVGVRLVPGRLRIEVWDGAAEPPVVGAPSTDDEAGRGLVLVGALSTRWGSYPTQQPGHGCGGKIVWCEVEAA